MRQSEWVRLFALARASWPSSSLPDETMAAWWPLLEDLDAADVEAALRTLALEPDRRWAPQPGEIRAAVHGPERDWTQALADLEQVISRVGSYQPPPAFDDPALGELVRRVGWRHLCASDLTDTTVRAQLRDTYRTICAHTAVTERRHLAVGAGHLTARDLLGLPGGDR